MSEQATVATRSKLMEAREAQRALPRALMAGEDAVLASAATFFPREPMEQPIPVLRMATSRREDGTLEQSVTADGMIDPWKLRIDRVRGRIYNVFAEAVRDNAGQVFANPPQIKKAPAKLLDWYDDVNGAGATIHTFAIDRGQTAAAEGIDYVLVNYPAKKEGVTLTEAEEARLGIRPTLVVYSAASVLEVVPETFRGNVRAKRARLMEEVEEPNGWGASCVEQVRVLYPGNGEKDSPERFARFEVWRRPIVDGKEAEWKDATVYEQGSMAPQIDVPLVAFPTGVSPTHGEFDAPPPLLGLAWKVIAHARKQCDLDSAQHAIGFPVYFVSGIDADDLRVQLAGGVGPSRMFSGPTDSDMKTVEPEGTAWESLQRALDEMKEQMHLLAKAPRSERAQGNITARGEILGQARAQVTLEMWKTLWENALNTIAYYAWLYLVPGANPEADEGWGEITLDATIIPDPSGQENVARLAHDQNIAGALSDETRFEIQRAAGFIPPSLTFAEEKGRLARSGPTMWENNGEDL